MENKYIVLFFVFLILSIAPASAAQISTVGNLENSISAAGTDQEKLDDLNSEIDDITKEIKDDANYIDDNWWKLWKWKKVKAKSENIDQNAKELESLSQEVNDTSNKLEEDSAPIDQTIENLTKDEGTVKNAEKMARKLQSKTRVSFAVRNVGELKNGDLVQFKSQDKYYHYLSYVNTTEAGIVFKSTNNKEIILSKEKVSSSATLKLVPSSTVNSATVANQAYQIQIEDLNQQIKEGNQTIEKGKDFRQIGGKLSGTCGSLIRVAAMLAAIGAVTSFIDGGALLNVARMISMCVALILPVGLYLYTSSFNMIDEGQNLMASATAGIAELNSFYSDLNHVLVTSNMNSTTEMNHEIHSSFNVTEDGRPLSSTDQEPHIITQPKNGTIIISTNGDFVYKPNNAFVGNDSFKFFIEDPRGLVSNVAYVNISVTRIDLNTPVAYDLNLSTTRNNALNGEFNATDADGDPLTYLTINGPKHGNITLNENGTFIYTPAKGFVGNDSFTYEADDSAKKSAPATVNIQINNQPPVSYDLNLTTTINKEIQGTLNATDSNRDQLTYEAVRMPAHGTLDMNTNGSFIYDPNKWYIGPDLFVYRVSDGVNESNLGVSRITVNPNDLPVANDMNLALFMDKNLTAFFSAKDKNGDELKPYIHIQPANGEVTILPDGKFIYKPKKGFKGKDTFMYFVKDYWGNSNFGRVNVTVN